MTDTNTPAIFSRLLLDIGMDASCILKTADGFFMLDSSIADILSAKGIADVPDASGKRFACSRFFDDWFLYAVPDAEAYTYSLLKLREQEHDAGGDAPADGDTPGVTISFISFRCEVLTACLHAPTDENRAKLSAEINRVVARRGQRHHKALKAYFKDPRSQGAYLVAQRYTRFVASLAKDGCLAVPDHYQKIALRKSAGKKGRLPRFVDGINQEAGRTVCDHKHIYLANSKELTGQEALVILATHTGNTSFYSFAAEVEYHAKFLTPLAKIKIPFFGRSVYDSAIRADMTVGDTEFQGPAPFYKDDSKIVKRQHKLHQTVTKETHF